MKTKVVFFFLLYFSACAAPSLEMRTQQQQEVVCNPSDPWSCRNDRLFCIKIDKDAACVPNTCGNGVVETPEECDRPDAISCASVIGGAGTFTCGSDCRWDYSGCQRCGNRHLNGLEPCDGDRFADGVSCEAFGYSGGLMDCLPSCQPDTRGCIP